MSYEERVSYINERAQKDYLSNDVEYNKGLKAIRDFGYQYVSGNKAVEYWCMCNNL